MAKHGPLSYLMVLGLTATMTVASVASGLALPPPDNHPRSAEPISDSFEEDSIFDGGNQRQRALKQRSENRLASNIRPNPKPSKCLSLARKIGASQVWWGRHVGSKEIDENDLFFTWGPRREDFNEIGCFRTKKDCDNWLYWKRTEYPIFTGIRPCRRGL